MTQARPQLTGAAAPASHLIESRAGTLTIPALADVVAHAAVLTCGDTGVAHLATALHNWGPAIDEDIHTVLGHGDPTHPGDPHDNGIDRALADVKA